MRSKWCKNNEHGWCFIRNPSECHCTCMCHPLRTKKSKLVSAINLLHEELLNTIKKLERFK